MLLILTFQTTYDHNLNFTWSVRKLYLVDSNSAVARLEEDTCLEFSCLFDAKELVSSDEINPQIKLVTIKVHWTFIWQ